MVCLFLPLHYILAPTSMASHTYPPAANNAITSMKSSPTPGFKGENAILVVPLVNDMGIDVKGLCVVTLYSLLVIILIASHQGRASAPV